MELESNVIYERTSATGEIEYYAKLHERNTLYPHERVLSAYEALIMVTDHNWKLVRVM